MRAVVVERPGGLEQLRLAEVPDPVPAAGEVLIEVTFAGCNWSDVQKRRGLYPDPVTYPAILGLEVSGLIRAVGSGVRGLAAGDRVAALTGPRMLGGYAEQVAVPAAYVMRLPTPCRSTSGRPSPWSRSRHITSSGPRTGCARARSCSCTRSAAPWACC
jgi:NADPH:quinone reductase